MRIFLTGAKGQLGTDLVERFTASGHTLTAVDIDEVDLTVRDDVLAAVAAARPDAVVHPAAFTAVDRCESEPDMAFAVNVLGTRHVAEAARRVDAPVLYVSTDYVFDGTKAEPYHEWDATNPQSVYGASKLAGEHEVLTSGASATVVRTAWVMGAHGSNMLKTVVSLRDRDDLAFVDDQRGSPTFTSDLSSALRVLSSTRAPGTFHVTNSGSVTWFGFVQAVLTAVGASPDQVRPIATAELDPPRPAPRPANSVLDNSVWRSLGFDPLPEYPDALRRALAELGL